jgi:SAM-dependent methyltransferase
MLSLMQKWRHYAARYGVLHATSAFLGRKSNCFWRLVGPTVTASYRLRWLSRDCNHIVNLGGGGNTAPHWLTADIDPRADVFIDITRPLPFDDESLDGVFLEEVIEHVNAPTTMHIIRECHRCLKNGKPLRISTPDLRCFIRLLDADCVPDGLVREMAMMQLGRTDVNGIELRTAATNSIFRDHGHIFIWDFDALAQAIYRGGFRQLKRTSYRDPDSLLGVYDSHAERFRHPAEMSLYIEATK